MFLLSKGGNHTDSTEDFSKVLLPWLGAVIETRLPASASGQDAAARFTELAESSGWLGDLRTKEIAAFADFKGDKAKANWFPNEAAAKAWKSHAMAPTYSIADQPLKEPSGLIADFTVYDKSNSDTTTGKGWHINANFKEADQLSNNIRYFVAGPVPKIIEGCDWIRTMNGGKAAQPISADPPFSFTVTADCIVYIAHGDQEQGKVAWLSDWPDTQQTVNVCGGMLEKPMPMKIYSKKFLKGEKVTPGANSSQPHPHGLMYITLVGQATATVADPGGKGEPAAEAKSNAAKTDASEATVAKVEKTLAAVQERLTQLQIEQSRIEIEVLKAQQKVNESRADAGTPGGRGPNPGGRGPNLGGRDPNMPPGQGMLRAADSPEYRKACVWATQQYQVLDTKCLSLVKTMQGLAKESPGLSAELQARISEMAAKVAAKRRAILEKIGSLYIAAGEWKSALAAYMQAYRDLPEDQRAKESNLQQTLADLCEKVQDYKTAAILYKSILDGVPEGQRWRNRPLCDKLCRALERAGDLKSALVVYKSMLEAMPPNMRDGDQGPANDINRKIENLERQLRGKP
jgi:tetratricopeptide (TPR) repeat protein